MQPVVCREGCVLGAQAELALVQHRLSWQPGDRVLLAPQPECAYRHAGGDGCWR